MICSCGGGGNRGETLSGDALHVSIVLFEEKEIALAQNSVLVHFNE